MNGTLSRTFSPAVEARRGTDRPALPNDPGFVALMLDTRLLASTQKVATIMVVTWAWYKDHCFPSDLTLAKRASVSLGTVQRSLRQLEQTGYIRREKTDPTPKNRTGRIIRLLWRTPQARAGAQGGQAPAIGGGQAPARDKPVVVVNQRIEQEAKKPPSRPRPERERAPVPEEAQAPEPAQKSPEPPEAPRAVASPAPAIPVALAPESTTAPEERPKDRQEALEPFEPLPAVMEFEKIPRPVEPSDLRAILSAAMAETPAPVSRAPIRPHRQVPWWATPPEEMARRAASTNDPVMKAELARRTAPPPPLDPPPQTLATPELLARLPGRADLQVEATHRLCLDLKDQKPPTWSFCAKAVSAVVTRRVLPEVLLSSHRQATGAKVRDRGCLFVAVWKRESNEPR